MDHRPVARTSFRWAVAASTCCAAVTLSLSAQAATWRAGRTSPRLNEIVAIDATGETGWPWGQEDLAGDGLATFQPQEQSIDIRTAYAATDASRFWVRAYVSDANSVGGNVTVFVFVDADMNAATGGSAAATAVHAQFTTDPSQGGYEYAIALKGNGSIQGFWQWRQPQQTWDAMQVPGSNADAEAGQDTDPILINGAQHGYVQAMVDLNVVGLTSACAANLYFRSVNEAGGQAAGDLDVGRVGACIPGDANGDHVPDVIVPPSGCTVDSQCAGGGVCVNGACVLPHPCVSDTDCSATEQCTPDGRCVPRATGTCTGNAQCGGLVCVGGQCVACTPGGTECGTGYRCGPNGACVAGPSTGAGGAPGAGGSVGDAGPLLGPDDKVEGGALHCGLAGGARDEPGVWCMLLALGLGWFARRPRRHDERA
ncbi:MAG: hypothetical protein HY898_26440 [Deltaproteobacteria bacterium]|nr:hypothetical protein [Deltaproteobacteria bacterium]